MAICDLDCHKRCYFLVKSSISFKLVTALGVPTDGTFAPLSENNIIAPLHSKSSIVFISFSFVIPVKRFLSSGIAEE